MALTFKNEVLVRVYLILAILIGPMAGLLMYRTLEISVLDRQQYLENGERFIQERRVEAERGNIYSRGGNLLATSVPYFEVYFDPY
ncbi:MAG: peptidoglycan glycosyltransferase, partial [Bacteroidota bacterium]